MALATKSPEQVGLMRAAGLVVAETLAAVRAAVAPGVTPQDLDELAAEEIRRRGAVPSFLGYHGYPATTCISVNDVVVHGIPDGRPLAEGDVVSVDCGAVLEGWHGDAAITVGVGELAGPVAALVSTCEQALAAGIAAMRVGGRLGDIGAAVEGNVRGRGGYGILTDYTGHGIGRAMHEPPAVPNLRGRRRGPRLEAGVVLAIEPMLTLGRPDVSVDADGWTVRTEDGSLAVHCEHTVAVTPDGPWVLTAGTQESERGLGASAPSA
jgi:methionyl aminopeptidase